MVQCGRAEESSTSEEASVSVADAGMTGAPSSTSGSASGDGTADSRGPDVGPSEPSDPTMDAGPGGSTGDGPDAPVDELSDEFDDPSTLARWSVREEVEGGTPATERIAIVDGVLEMVPSAGGWFGDWVGAMLFKTIEGDFMMETHVTAASRSDPTAAPLLPFNSGGLIARDPASAPGQQSWITHNVGYQSSSVATEGKTTIDSQSILYLVDGIHHGRLRMCRFGDSFVLARWLDDESAWMQTQRFERPDLPDVLQVGMMANGWNSTGSQPDTRRTPDVHVSFDYVRFSRPADEDDCLR